jgi:hypothetical protein
MYHSIETGRFYVNTLNIRETDKKGVLKTNTAHKRPNKPVGYFIFSETWPRVSLT